VDRDDDVSLMRKQKYTHHFIVSPFIIHHSSPTPLTVQCPQLMNDLIQLGSSGVDLCLNISLFALGFGG
jgi:hypothetical protein